MELNHVCTRAAWDHAVASGTYAPPELARDGFLHCCTPDQLAFVLGRHFAGVQGLVVLRFAAADVGEVRWVKSEADQAAFPHLYGSIRCEVVIK